MNNEPEPNDAEAYYIRGNSYYSQGRYEEAIADYNKVIELESGYVDVYNNRGNSYESMGNHGNAGLD